MSHFAIDIVSLIIRLYHYYYPIFKTGIYSGSYFGGGGGKK